MTFEYRDDTTCDKLVAQPDTDDDRNPVVFLSTTGINKGVYVPVTRVEEVVAGIRDAARTAAGQQPKPAAAYSDGMGRAYCLTCASTTGADVPLTIDGIDPQEACAKCCRYVADVARQTTGQADTVRLCTCGNYAAPHPFPGCAKPVPAVGQPAEAQATDRAAAYRDTARRAHRRLAAVERLVSGRPGYHQITVKELLAAMSDETVEDER